MATITGTNSKDWLYGTNFDDDIFLLDGNDYTAAGRGDDFVYGGNGRDFIRGFTGHDVLRGELLFGGDGDDILTSDSDSSPDSWFASGKGDDLIFLSAQDNAPDEQIRVDTSTGHDVITVASNEPEAELSIGIIQVLSFSVFDQIFFSFLEDPDLGTYLRPSIEPDAGTTGTYTLTDEDPFVRFVQEGELVDPDHIAITDGLLIDVAGLFGDANWTDYSQHEILLGGIDTLTLTAI